MEQLRVTGYYRDMVAALRANEYDVLEYEGPGSIRHANILRKGWMFVGTVTPLGDFGSAELVLHGHNNDKACMAAVVVALAASAR